MIQRILVKGFRILRDFDWIPQEGVNVIVGDNAAGKSTILDAIELAMRCRVNGMRVEEALDPYWFNRDDVEDFFAAVSGGDATAKPPEILIELYFKKDSGSIAHLQGVHNSLGIDVPGVALSIVLNDELRSEFFSVIQEDSRRRHLLPIEYYSVSWRSFKNQFLIKAPEPVACFRIDANPTRSSRVVDYYARSTVDAHISDEEKREISLRYRNLKQDIDEEILDQIVDDEGEGIIEDISFQMDQSSRSDWRNSITIEKEGLPLSLAGRGMQVEARTRLALKKSEAKKVLLMEEPENHLSHTSLMRLMGLIEKHLSGRQLFVTTHSAFVLNRLGLNKLALLAHGNSPTSINYLSKDTVAYFRRQSGVDSLRIVLGRKVVLVEGPSDEMIFNWAYEKECAKSPQEDDVDVIAYGVRGKRALELAHALDKGHVAVLRDNDGKPPSKWRKDAEIYLDDGRQMFIDDDVSLGTLEPQMVYANLSNLPSFAAAIGFSKKEPSENDLVEYMTDNKTEWAWSFVSGDVSVRDSFSVPAYIADAVEFISQSDYE